MSTVVVLLSCDPIGLSALVGVVTVAVLVYDILSTREGGKKEIS